jgi:hypothetical protein
MFRFGVRPHFTWSMSTGDINGGSGSGIGRDAASGPLAPQFVAVLPPPCLMSPNDIKGMESVRARKVDIKGRTGRAKGGAQP